jgi:hypothetical protein
LRRRYRLLIRLGAAAVLVGLGFLIRADVWTPACWAVAGLILMAPLLGSGPTPPPVSHSRPHSIAFDPGGGPWAVTLTSIGAKPHRVVVALGDALGFPVPEVANLVLGPAGPWVMIASGVTADEAAQLRDRIAAAGGQADVRVVAGHPLRTPPPDASAVA